MSGQRKTPTVQAQGSGKGSSVFCKVFETNRGTGRPDSIDPDVIHDGTEHGHASVLRGPNNTVLDVFGIRIAKRAENLSIEVNVPRHIPTSFLLGALIVALIKRKELTA